jgi:phosphohistidine phosphatase
MKLLTLIRHAKSSHDNPAMRDIHRPLNLRGRREAAAMGRHLDVAFRFSPDLMVSSTATRAIATARMIAQETGYDEWSIKQEERIYEAPVSALLEVVRETGDSVNHLAVFGHNPGLENFCNWLCGKRVVEGLRTAGAGHRCMEGHSGGQGPPAAVFVSRPYCGSGVADGSPSPSGMTRR